MAAFNCFDCQKVYPLFNETNEKKCPSCGGTRGEVISGERFKEGLEAGTFFAIDPRTGKRKKK